MKKELTVFELVRLLAAIVVALVIFVAVGEAAYALTPEVSGLVGYLVFLLFGLFMPAFSATLIACILPSWRYRTIAATIMLMLVTVWYLFDAALSLTGVMDFLFALVRLSAGMSGALAATFFWQQLRDRHFDRATPAPVTPRPAQKIPKPSSFLIGLSLLSIPATYLTIFVSAFLVVGYSTLFILGMLEVGWIPYVFIFAALVAPLVALWAGLRAIFVIFRPRPPFQPAHELDMAAHPQTMRMIDDLCAAIKTRKPDHVLLHAEPTFFVTQQKTQTFDGLMKGRTLALGMPLLPHLTGQELKAILAHEFAHFSGRDTLYSVWVAQVYRGLGESIGNLRAGMAGAGGVFGMIMNILLLPSMLFLSTFFHFFASIDAILSRKRELRADWIAAMAAGRDAFVSALQKVVQYSAHFAEHQREIDTHEPAGLFQQHRALASQDAAQLDAYLEEAMQAPEHEFATHPALRTRIGNLPEQTPAQLEPDDAFLAELTADEEELSDSVREMVHQFEAAYQQAMQAQAAEEGTE